MHFHKKLVTLSIVNVLYLYPPPAQADVLIDNWYDTYNHTSQKDWNGTCRTGNNQSPINIRTVNRKKLDEPLSFNGYSSSVAINLEVNAHYIEGQVSKTQRDGTFINNSDIWINGGGLGASKFQFHNFHFHWGSTEGQGSEHSINNTYSEMEMHIVHWNVKAGEDLEDVVKHSTCNNSLAILAVRFKFGNKNEKLEPLLQEIKKLSKSNSTTTMTMMLKDLLPENTNEFYRYNGSLTSPPCYEIASWTIFTQLVHISFEQMGIMREENDLSNNYRAIQYLNRREVDLYTMEGMPASGTAIKSIVLRNKYVQLLAIFIYGKHKLNPLRQ